MYSALNKGYRRNRKRANVTSRLSRALYRQRASRGNVVAAARSLNSAARGLQLAAGEFKAVDLAATSYACDTSSTLVLLNGIARGDEIFERTGREIVMKSIEVRWISRATNSTGTDQQHRLLIVYDRQTNGAALTAAQVLTELAITAPRNLENRKRFTILHDEAYVVNGNLVSAGPPIIVNESNSQVVKKWYRRLNHPVTFNSGDAGTVADITTGSLYAIVLGSNVAGATAGNMLISSRVRYQDK